MRSSKHIFRAGSRIGFADAEDDWEYLNQCFVDIGHVQQALNTEDSGSILLGRTGAGKSAAIIHIKNVEDNVIELNPEDLSLNFISNSSVLSFFHNLGVNLDLFFQLLWRHVLCVELLNYHYNVKKSRDFEGAISRIRELIGTNPAKRLALSYLETWGTSFWEESQKRIKEIVEGFEKELTGAVNLSELGIPLNAQGSTRITGEQKTEIINKVRKVVNDVQIRELSSLMDIMAEDIFNNRQEKYYIVVDRLDENWVDDSLRYKLIRALIESIKAFRKIRTVKLIIALRSDLLERVYKYTRDGGFQEEKYEDFNIPMSWRDEQLLELVNRRMGELYKRQYTGAVVGFYDVFPEKYRQEGSCFGHLLVRTQYRPRDIIAFINQILIAVSGKADINANDIDRAEMEYSKKRLQALCTEWQNEHPNLETLLETLRSLPARLTTADIADQIVEDCILALAIEGDAPDQLPQFAQAFISPGSGSGNATVEDFKVRILQVLYKVGALGVKPSGYDRIHFSYRSSHVMTGDEIRSSSALIVSPMLWQALGCRIVRGRGNLAESIW